MDLKQFYDKASGKFSDFCQKIESLGYEAISNLKTYESFSRKVASDYAGDFTRVKDIVRCTLVTENPSNLIEVLEGEFKILEIKNTLHKEGYGDVKLIVSFAGITCEIQINTPRMLAAKSADMISLSESTKKEAEYLLSQGIQPALGHTFYDIERISEKGCAFLFKTLGVLYYQECKNA